MDIEHWHELNLRRVHHIGNQVLEELRKMTAVPLVARTGSPDPVGDVEWAAWLRVRHIARLLDLRKDCMTPFPEATREDARRMEMQLHDTQMALTRLRAIEPAQFWLTYGVEGEGPADPERASDELMRQGWLTPRDDGVYTGRIDERRVVCIRDPEPPRAAARRRR